MMKYTISSNLIYKYRYWFCGAYAVMGILYFVIFTEDYSKGASTFSWVLDLILSLFWLAGGIVYLFQFYYQNPPATNIKAKEEGITYKQSGIQHLLKWNKIRDIKLNNYSLTVLLKSNNSEQLAIHMKYMERQTFKQELQQFTEAHKIAYTSKY